jgi:hypothetical protein
LSSGIRKNNKEPHRTSMILPVMLVKLVFLLNIFQFILCRVITPSKMAIKEQVGSLFVVKNPKLSSNRDIGNFQE